MRLRFARRHPAAYLSAHFLIGLALAIACAWAFLAIADEVPEQGRMAVVDTSTVAWLQTHGTESGESIFNRISWLGGHGLTAIVVIVAAVFLARRSWRRFALVTIVYAGSVGLNQLLKVMFHRGRPAAATEFVSSGSFSFPSGHAMESIAVYGALAYLIVERFPTSRYVAWLGWLGLAGIIGFSRVYLGVHYASDVTAGFAAGFVWLFTCVTGYRFAEREPIAESH